MPQKADLNSPPDQADHYKGKAFRVVLVTVILAGLSIWALNIFWGTDFQGVPAQGLILPLAVNTLSIYLAAWRIQVLAAREIGLMTGVKSVSLVATLLIVFPSRLSDLIKPVYLLERDGLPLARGFSVLVFERVLDVLMLAAMLGVLMLGLGSSAEQGMTRAISSVGVICIILGIGLALLFFAPGVLQKLVTWLPFTKLRNLASALLDALKQTSDKIRLFKGANISVLIWLSSYLIVVFYLRALPPTEGVQSMGVIAALMVFVAGTIGLVATVTPGGVGTYEFAIALALNSYGVPIAEGLVHGLALRILVLFPSLLVVLYMLMFDNFNISALRRRSDALRTESDPQKAEND